ncbi:MAG TPA: Crp/Fnr family transcriptional regulator [Clostridia bacterium]|nr:Crp/Fnr family transcriptional regulator [Clostridia bacterium]
MPPTRTDAIATLRKAPLFSAFDDQQHTFLGSRIVERSYAAGEHVFGEGEPCAGLFVVQSGNVRIYKTSASGREQTLSIEGPGSTIAELPVFDGGPYPASTQALTDSTLLFVSKQDFHALCLRYPEVTLKVLAVVGRRLRHLVGIIEELSFTTVRHRLAALLVRMARTEGKKTASGTEITLSATNQDIAAQIGTVRELVSRNMSRFQSEGLIRIEGRTVVVPSIEKLAMELDEAS